MRNVYIYNDAMDDVVLNQLAQLEEWGEHYEEPEYRRSKVDERDLEILVDCLGAGRDAYEDNEDMDAVNRINRLLTILGREKEF